MSLCTGPLITYIIVDKPMSQMVDVRGYHTQNHAMISHIIDLHIPTHNQLLFITDKILSVRGKCVLISG